MAKIKTEQQQEGEPIVMEFEVEEGDMKGLRTLVFDDYSEQWAEFILANRRTSPRLRHSDRAYSQRPCGRATMEIREPAYRYADACKQAEIYERADSAVFLRHRKSLGNA